MRSLLLAAVFAFTSVLSFAAPTSIAVVNMEKVILAHPLTAANKAKLEEVQKGYIAQRDVKENAFKDLYAKFQAAVDEMRDETRAEAKRREAAARAEDLRDQCQKADAELRELVADLREKLRREEFKLFGQVMDAIKTKLDKLAKDKGYDIVIDRSAERASAPIPQVMYASDSIDITDALIEATGGDKARADAALAASAKIFSDEK